MPLIIKIILGVVIVSTVFLLLLILSQGIRTIGAIENIDGIPYPTSENSIAIEEKLAHVDVYLREPVLAKKLNLVITFTPVNITELRVGVRADEFWLSYPDQHVLYTSDTASTVSEPITKTVSVPLTDKLQETDRSVDLMFFAANQESTSEVDEKTTDTVAWLIHDIQAEVKTDWPSLAAIKDYIKSIIHKERAL